MRRTLHTTALFFTALSLGACSDATDPDGGTASDVGETDTMSDTGGDAATADADDDADASVDDVEGPDTDTGDTIDDDVTDASDVSDAMDDGGDPDVSDAADAADDADVTTDAADAGDDIGPSDAESGDTSDAGDTDAGDAGDADAGEDADVAGPLDPITVTAAGYDGETLPGAQVLFIDGSTRAVVTADDAGVATWTPTTRDVIANVISTGEGPVVTTAFGLAPGDTILLGAPATASRTTSGSLRLTPPAETIVGASSRVTSIPCVLTGSVGGRPPYATRLPEACADLYDDFPLFFGVATSERTLRGWVALDGLSVDADGHVDVVLTEWSDTFGTYTFEATDLPTDGSSVELRGLGYHDGLTYWLEAEFGPGTPSATVDLTWPTVSTDILTTLTTYSLDDIYAQHYRITPAVDGGRTEVSTTDLLEPLTTFDVTVEGDVSVAWTGADPEADVLVTYLLITSGDEWIEWHVLAPVETAGVLTLPSVAELDGAPVLGSGAALEWASWVLRDAADTDGHAEHLARYPYRLNLNLMGTAFAPGMVLRSTEFGAE